jgi:hypothetical protein
MTMLGVEEANLERNKVARTRLFPLSSPPLKHIKPHFNY